MGLGIDQVREKIVNSTDVDDDFFGSSWYSIIILDKIAMVTRD